MSKTDKNFLPSSTLYTHWRDSLKPDGAFPIPIKRENKADELWIKNQRTTFHISQWNGRSLGLYLLVSFGLCFCQEISIFIIKTCFNLLCMIISENKSRGQEFSFWNKGEHWG